MTDIGYGVNSIKDSSGLKIADVAMCLGEINKILSENELKRRMLKEYEDDIIKINSLKEEVSEEIAEIKMCINILQKISDERNEQGRRYIEDLINSALNSIFPDRDYSIYIDEYVHGTRKHMKVLLSEGSITRELKFSHGTGIKQIISFIFNVALIVFKGSSRFIFLDETLASVSAFKSEVMSDLLTSLMEKNHFQFFIIDQKDNLFVNDNIVVYRMKYDPQEGTIIDKIEDRRNSIAISNVHEESENIY